MGQYKIDQDAVGHPHIAEPIVSVAFGLDGNVVGGAVKEIQSFSDEDTGARSEVCPGETVARSWCGPKTVLCLADSPAMGAI